MNIRVQKQLNLNSLRSYLALFLLLIEFLMKSLYALLHIEGNISSFLFGKISIYLEHVMQ